MRLKEFGSGLFCGLALAGIVGMGGSAMELQPETVDFRSFDIAEIERQREEKKTSYLPFLRVPDLHCGLYVLPAGATDGQSPHGEDEVYYVLEGKGKFRAGDEETDVKKGSVLYVRRSVDHRFFDITEDLKILVFFASG